LCVCGVCVWCVYVVCVCVCGVACGCVSTCLSLNTYTYIHNLNAHECVKKVLYFIHFYVY